MVLGLYFLNFFYVFPIIRLDVDRDRQLGGYVIYQVTKFFPRSKFWAGYFQYICRRTYVCAINLDYTAKSGNRDLEGNVGL